MNENFGYTFSYPNLTLENECQNHTGDFSNHRGKLLFFVFKVEKNRVIHLHLLSELEQEFAVSFKWSTEMQTLIFAIYWAKMISSFEKSIRVQSWLVNPTLDNRTALNSDKKASMTKIFLLILPCLSAYWIRTRTRNFQFELKKIHRNMFS